LTDLPQILIGELGRAMGKFLDWFTDSRLSRAENFRMVDIGINA